METDPGNFLFDIETGSLVTWPVPYRIVTYKTNQQLVIETRHIPSLEGYKDFEAFSRNYLQQGMDTLVKIQIMMPPYSLPYEQAAMVSLSVQAMFADPAPGDQNITIDLATGAVLAR